MALSQAADLADHTSRDHGFHELGVRAVVSETGDARSFVLDVPSDLAAAYAYEPGQFLTFRCRIGGEAHLRSYSMSSAPMVDGAMQVTVKRVPGGLVSNWMVDTLEPGDRIEATLPAGVFGRRTAAGDVLAFAGGSGITPVLSVLKSVLATTGCRARLFYANRHPDSVIFEAALSSLAEDSGGRLEIVRHLDTEQGLVDSDELERFAPDAAGLDCYVCGPAPFMELVEARLLAAGAAPDSIHIERFTPPAGGPVADDVAPAGPASGDDGPVRVTVELDGRVEATDHRAGTTVLQTARQLGWAPPFSCEAGNCATCIARLAEGEVMMHANNALTDDEVAEGWILTCQSVPTSPSVHVVYGWGD